MNGFRVVLLGVIGSGKTTLFNHLTSNKEFVRAGGDSATKQIVVGVSNVVDRLEVVDTPGFEVTEDKILHAAGVIAALTIGDLNRILIITKFERDARMINAIQLVINPLKRYRDQITIVVSHWDHSENKQEDQKNIEKKIKENFNIESILFYSKQENPPIISLSILTIIEKQQNMRIKLTDTEIFSQFDLLTLDGESKNTIEQDKQGIFQKFRNTALIFSNYIDFRIRLDDPKAIDILHYMSLEIKKIAESYVKEFEKSHGDYMNKFYDTNNQNVGYLHHIYLKKTIVQDLEYVIKKAQEKMTKTKNNYYQYLKQCPNCKLIWMKVVGCDRKTTCGNRVNYDDDNILKQSSALRKFKFSIIKGQLQVDEINPQQNSQQQEVNSFEKWLYKLVKNNQSFKNILENINSQNQFINLLKNKIGNTFYFFKLKYTFGLIGEDNQQMIQYLYQQFNIKKEKINKTKQFGCGQILIWKDLPMLSGSQLNELISTELLDYFSDKEQLISDETKFLEKYYKDQVNTAIQDQINNAKYLQKIN